MWNVMSSLQEYFSIACARQLAPARTAVQNYSMSRVAAIMIIPLQADES